VLTQHNQEIKINRADSTQPRNQNQPC